MNCCTCDCSAGVGDSGYEAVREWRSVQEERPSCSMSGGQSLGKAAGFDDIDLETEEKSEKDVQDRQL